MMYQDVWTYVAMIAPAYTVEKVNSKLLKIATSFQYKGNEMKKFWQWR